MSEEVASAGAAPGKGKAMFGMILAILGFFASWGVGVIYIFSPVVAYILIALSAIGLVLSIMGMKGSKGMGITGIILGLFGLIVGIMMLMAGMSGAESIEDGSFQRGFGNMLEEAAEGAAEDIIEDLGH